MRNTLAGLVLVAALLPLGGCSVYNAAYTSLTSTSSAPAVDPFASERPTTAAVGVTMPDMKDFLHPWDVQTYIERVTEFAGLPAMNDGAAFVGDSLTDYGRWSEAYPALRVRNFGIAGDTTVGLLHRVSQVIDARPTSIYLMIGTNDLEYGRTPAEIAANVELILDKFAAGLPNATVYVENILPREKQYSERVIALNTLLKAAADKRHLKYFDLYSHFVTADGTLDPTVTVSGLHLAGKGYERWRSVINNAMYFRDEKGG